MPKVTINARPLGPLGLARLEQTLGGPAPSGAFWYDPRSGLIGRMGAGASGRISPGLPLGSPPPRCSGSGSGVFLNGRELHPSEVVLLAATLGRVPPGRYFLNADGDAGYEGSAAVINLFRERCARRVALAGLAGLAG